MNRYKTTLRSGVLLLLITLLLGLGNMAAAQTGVLACDPFLSGNDPSAGEYVDGDNLVGANPTVDGFSGAWQPIDWHSPLTGATGLTHPLVPSAGGGVYHLHDANDKYGRGSRNLSVTPSGGEFWMSGLFRWDQLREVRAGQSEVLWHRVTTPAGTIDSGTWMSGVGDGKYGFGVAAGSSGWVLAGANPVLGTTYLLITQVEDEGGNPDGGGGNFDAVRLYVFDGVGGDDISSVESLIATADVTVSSTIDEVWDSGQPLTQFGVLETATSTSEWYDWSYDEARIGDTLADVTGVPSNQPPVADAGGPYLVAVGG
jgi:hypothetical protein